MSLNASRGRKREHVVWNYFKYDSETDRSSCMISGVGVNEGKLCGRLIAGKHTSNLRSHLKYHHRSAYKEECAARSDLKRFMEANSAETMKTGNICNLAMEKVKIQVMPRCKYKSNGCDAMLPDTEKTGHEDSCEFRPYSCPCLGGSCKWKGSLTQIMPHLEQKHKMVRLTGDDIVFLATSVNVPGPVDWIMMQTCYGFHFVLVLEKQKAEGDERNSLFYSTVQLIGTRKQAESFVCRLELNSPKQRLTWEGKVRSIRDDIQSAFSTKDCLVFYPHHFEYNGCLSLNVTINMC